MGFVAARKYNLEKGGRVGDRRRFDVRARSRRLGAQRNAISFWIGLIGPRRSIAGNDFGISLIARGPPYLPLWILFGILKVCVSRNGALIAMKVSRENWLSLFCWSFWTRLVGLSGLSVGQFHVDDGTYMIVYCRTIFPRRISGFFNHATFIHSANTNTISVS